MANDFPDPGRQTTGYDRENVTGLVVTPLVVFFVSLVIYLLTLAPTTSLWDSGEFISVGWILGIPHPPGTPLYVLFSRFWSLIPWGGGIAFRVNLISAVTGALAAALVSWLVVAVLAWYLGRGSRLAAYAGGLAAGVFAAFSLTIWGNSVEAEVYAPATFIMGLALVLVVLWGRGQGKPGNERKLLLLLYLLGLSIGNHLMSFLVAPAVFVFVVLTDRRAGVGLLATGLLFFLLYNGVLWFGGLEPHGVLWLVLSVVVLVGLLVMVPQYFDWRFIGLGLLLFVLGLTVHLYLPLRSALSPVINEGEPTSFGAFFDMINRKQYAPPSIFDRQAPFYYQLGMFWDYLVMQWGSIRLAFVPLLLGTWGFWRHYRRGERRFFWSFLVLFLVCSLGLIIYINFKLAPGQALDKYPDPAAHEVRERDYFYTPTYYFLAVWIGLGVAAGVDWLRGKLRGFRGWLRYGGAASAVVVFLGLLVLPVAGNYWRCDQSRNYIPHDFGLNLLNSVGRSGLLFTNGDNDTFPLWFLQAVKGVRRDVTVLNLSLLKTPWYPRQLRDGPTRAPISYSDEQLARMRYAQVAEDMTFRSGRLRVPLKKGQLLGPEVQVMYNLVLNARWRRPVYFAVSVPTENRGGFDRYLSLEGLPTENRGGFDRYLSLEGLVFRLTQKESDTGFDFAACRKNVDYLYSYRSMFDPTIYKDDETRGRISNYVTSFILLAEENIRAGRRKEAIPYLKRAIYIMSMIPHYRNILERLVSWLGEIYTDQGSFSQAREAYRSGLKILGRSLLLEMGLGKTYYREGKYDTALIHFQAAQRMAPDNPDVLQSMYMSLLNVGREAEAAKILENYVKLRPGDEQAKAILKKLKKGKDKD